YESTGGTLGLGLLALLTHPDQMAALRQDPSLINGAVEEILRYVDVTHSGRRRVAAADIDIGGQLIKAGEGIIAHNPTANRDVAKFSDPHRFDIRRDARGHMTFGFGIHQCLGQPLARMELQLSYASLLKRMPNLRLAVPFEQLKFLHHMSIYGLETLPISW